MESAEAVDRLSRWRDVACAGSRARTAAMRRGFLGPGRPHVDTHALPDRTDSSEVLTSGRQTQRAVGPNQARRLSHGVVLTGRPPRSTRTDSKPPCSRSVKGGGSTDRYTAHQRLALSILSWKRWHALQGWHDFRCRTADRCRDQTLRSRHDADHHGPSGDFVVRAERASGRENAHHHTLPCSAAFDLATEQDPPPSAW